MEGKWGFNDPNYVQMREKLREQYSAAEPYPHVVIDNFLPVEVCEQVLADFPKPEEIEWLRFEKHHSRKLATKGAGQFRAFTRDLFSQLNGADCLEWLESLTGIESLIPDPHFLGGGLHQIQRDGFLKVHTDFNFHTKLKLDRRINLIIYFNKDWHEEYNGHLELWDRTMSKCVRKILPVYNRCVIFSTTDWSYHGHPEKLTCPEDRTRKSLALYYYSNGRPEEEKSAAHGTVWQERPSSHGLVRTAYTRTLGGAASILETSAKRLRQISKVGMKTSA